MPAFALEAFERQAEAFMQARAWREWQYQSGQRPGRGLVTLYERDFPSFTSTELWADVQDADAEDPRQKQVLSALLAAANLEGRTREYASRAANWCVRTTVNFEDEDIVWREAPARWPLIGDVPRRHELAEVWRSTLSSDLNPDLARWHEALRVALPSLTDQEWLPFWADLRGLDLSQVARLATTTLEQSAGVYGHALGIYLAQLQLPIDDVWVADADWALRGARFDVVFADQNRMPVVIRSFGGLGIKLEEQLNVHFEAGPAPGVQCQAADVPHDVHVLLRLIGGYQDYLRSLRGLGMAQHLAHTDATLPFWQRWLGDDTPTLGYGLLLEGLGRDRAWLAAQLEYTASDDYRIICHVAWLARVRRDAALALYEQHLWQSEPGGSLASDYEVAMSEAVRVHHFGAEYLRPMLDAPWSTLGAAVRLRAEVFAAQLRAYLAREFDEEWWRNGRAARFLIQELWRPGRRSTAEELLGFMGYEGFDPAVLWAEFSEVLSPL